MKAIEVTGSVNQDGQIALDQPISTAKSIRFRGVLLFPEADHTADQEWSAAAINVSVQDFLDDPSEDIYTLEDGDPIDDEA